MVDNDWKTHAEQVVPGAIGALTALRWIGGTRWKLVAALIGGSAAAYYGGETIAELSGLTIWPARFVLGLFSMAIASKVFDVIAQVPTNRVIDKLLKKIGLLL